MREVRPLYRIFSKEWRARERMLIAFGGVMTLLLAYMLGGSDPNPVPLGVVSAVAFAALGVRLFTADEADPARSFIYQLPVARRRLLGIKLLALATQVAPLALIPLIGIHTIVISRSRFFGNYPLEFRLYLTIAVGSALAIPLLGAIVSLHMRSAIVAIVVTLALAVLLGVLILLPDVLSFRYVDRFNDRNLIDYFMRYPWGMIGKMAVAAAALAAWLFFLFCRTRIQEVRPGARSALVFLFAIGAAEVFYTLFYTGWRDLAYWIFGI